MAAAVIEVAKLRRDVDALRTLVAADRPGSRGEMTVKDRRAVKSEIEWCIQELDELRSRLTGAVA